MERKCPKYNKELNIAFYKNSILSGVIFFALSIAACYLMIEKSSILLYLIAGLYFIFIPVLKNKERMIIIGLHMAGMLVFMLVSKLYHEYGIEILVIEPLIMALSSYQHTLRLRLLRITKRLKKNTIYSERDELTGLLNRRGLKNRIDIIWKKCILRGESVAVIELDIDFFKQFNDAFGHPCGDQCLKSIAKALRASFVQDRAIITRTGGEEFLIIIKNADQRKVLTIARRIRKNIEKLAIIQSCQKVSKYVTVSIGITSAIPSDEDTFEHFYEKADEELYRAKTSGRNCVCFDGIAYYKKGFYQQKRNIV